MTFLAFKKSELPVGKKTSLAFSKIATEILERHYKPSVSSSRYYSPLRTSNPAKRWLSQRYGSTSLQRVATDTFGDILLHTKGTSWWGWRSDYVARLAEHLAGRKIPAFDLAVWLFRGENWKSQSTPENIRDFLFDQYDINELEIETLFDLSISSNHRLQEEPISERELLDAIGWPPDVIPDAGLALHLLELERIGPVRRLRYRPTERLNVITGDNSFGKTFLLDCVWWALTGDWIDGPAQPPEDAPREAPRIRFQHKQAGGARIHDAEFLWNRRDWSHPTSLHDLPGLVIYARYDGSFAIWDPARITFLRRDGDGRPRQMFFRRADLWDGLRIEDPLDGKEHWICNGLISDLVNWQRDGGYADRFNAYTAMLEQLSSEAELLVPGEPKRLLPDSRDLPSLRFPYGNVPLRHCSAGVQRVVALGYLLVWAWFEHLESSRQLRRDPQRTLVFLMDEVEAHLHPRWQRLIVPAVIKALSGLVPDGQPQIHLATHSPMVMTGLEVIAEENLDSLHHLDLRDNFVEIEKLPLFRRGRADRWLISKAFGLQHARSREAEDAIEAAKKLQLGEGIRSPDVQEVHRRLARYLAPDDDFWPRWLFFAKSHGADV